MFSATICLIHTWLQPGVHAQKIAGNRLNGLPVLPQFWHAVKAWCD